MPGELRAINAMVVVKFLNSNSVYLIIRIVVRISTITESKNAEINWPKFESYSRNWAPYNWPQMRAVIITRAIRYNVRFIE